MSSLIIKWILIISKYTELALTFNTLHGMDTDCFLLYKCRFAMELR